MAFGGHAASELASSLAPDVRASAVARAAQTDPTDPTHPAISAAADRDLPDLVRVSLATAALVLMWNAHWLLDLTDPNLLAASTDGSQDRQVLFLSVGFAVAAALARLGFGRLKPLVNRPMMAFVAWSVVTTVTSVDPSLSLRRFGLFLLSCFIVAGVLVIPRSKRQFALILFLATSIILGASYFAIVFLPELSIHNAYDMGADPDHAGLWRGIFDGKNTAGMAMMVVIFAGLFVASSLARPLGWGVVGLAVVFLLGSHSKTALATLPVVFLAIASFQRVRSRAVKLAILLGPTVFFALISVGSILAPPIKSVLDAVMADPSFTGRSGIWEFALASIMARPVTGWGYGAFWGTSETLYGSDTDSWAPAAAHAHNGYLDAGLNSGVLGMVLLVAVYVATPLRDILALSRREGGLDDVTRLFAHIWFYGLLSASFEPIFQNTNSSMCYMMMLAVIGLRLRANYGVAP